MCPCAVRVRAIRRLQAHRAPASPTPPRPLAGTALPAACLSTSASVCTAGALSARSHSPGHRPPQAHAKQRQQQQKQQKKQQQHAPAQTPSASTKTFPEPVISPCNQREEIYIRFPFPSPAPRPAPDPPLQPPDPQPVFDLDALESHADWASLPAPGAAPDPRTLVPVYPGWRAELEAIRKEVNARVPLQVRHVPMQAPYVWFQPRKYNGPGKLPGFASTVFNATVWAVRRKRDPSPPHVPGLDAASAYQLRRPLYKSVWVPDLVEPYVMKQHWIGVLSDPSLPWREMLGANPPTANGPKVSEHDRLVYTQNAIQNAEEDRVLRMGVIAGKKTTHRLAVVRWGAASRLFGASRVVFGEIQKQAAGGEKTAQAVVDAMAQIAANSMAIFFFARLRTMEASHAELQATLHSMFRRFAFQLPQIHTRSYPRRRFEQPQRGDERRVPARVQKGSPVPGGQAGPQWAPNKRKDARPNRHR